MCRWEQIHSSGTKDPNWKPTPTFIKTWNKSPSLLALQETLDPLWCLWNSRAERSEKEKYSPRNSEGRTRGLAGSEWRHEPLTKWLRRKTATLLWSGYKGARFSSNGINSLLDQECGIDLGECHKGQSLGGSPSLSWAYEPGSQWEGLFMLFYILPALTTQRPNFTGLVHCKGPS